MNNYSNLKEIGLIVNPSFESTYYGMKAFPGFNMLTRPYVLIKDRSTLSVVNLSKQACMIVL